MKNASPRKKIFVSYRVHDTAGETGRLMDVLRSRFSPDQLFHDIDNLEPGVDFSDAIEKHLDTCDVVLAVIGPNWIGEKTDGEPRIKEPHDWVRMEVATALRRNVRVVPVLVDGGALPKPEQLPDDLQTLLRRQTIEITNKRWRYDTDQLIGFLINTVGIQPRPQFGPQPPPASKKSVWPYVLGGFGLCVIVLAIIGVAMNEQEKEKNNAQTPQYITGNNSPVNPPQNTSNTNNGNGFTEEVVNITGNWVEDDNGERSTFVLQQNGSGVNVAVQAMGQTIANGTGEVSGRNVLLTVPILGINTVVQLTLSDDGRALTGNYTMQGVQQYLRLVRM